MQFHIYPIHRLKNIMHLAPKFVSYWELLWVYLSKHFYFIIILTTPTTISNILPRIIQSIQERKNYFLWQKLWISKSTMDSITDLWIDWNFSTKVYWPSPVISVHLSWSYATSHDMTFMLIHIYFYKIATLWHRPIISTLGSFIFNWLKIVCL